MTPPPPPLPPEIQAARDADHLQLLEIGFYISGVVTAFRFIWFFAFVVIFAVAGLGTALAAKYNHGGSSGSVPPAFIFFILSAVFGFILVMVLVFAGLEVYAGRCLKKRQRPIFIQIVAAIYCLSIPWGTALGVFTFMVLNRPSVKTLFGSV
jgi:hypothetical protein